MPLEDFIICVYCLVEDFFKIETQGKKLRQRGFAPKVTDTEIITMEIVGEFM